MNDKLTAYLGLAQTFLFAPGHRPEFFTKALNSSSKAIIIDLEDAVPPEQKTQAREHIREFWQSCSAASRQKLLIRINPIDSPFTNDDVAFLNTLSGELQVVLPKAESFQQLGWLVKNVPHLHIIIPIIESAHGIDRVKEIAAHPLTLRLALGNIDMQADLGLICDALESELLPVRFAITLASRLANIAPPIDGVTTAIHQPDLLVQDTHRAKRLGFGAKLCIHPKQVDIVIGCFLPSTEEIEYAKRVIAADQSAQGAAVQLDGKMIDRPVVLLAKRTLQLACLS
jgi:citrate lyase subunit beta/citryl-CoA lyase